RIAELRKIPFCIRGLSIEPMLGPLDRPYLGGIHWAIVGGESGPGARTIDPAWVTDIRDQCRACGIAFFFKQWGGVQKSLTGRVLDGRTWGEVPDTSTLQRYNKC